MKNARTEAQNVTTLTTRTHHSGDRRDGPRPSASAAAAIRPESKPEPALAPGEASNVLGSSQRPRNTAVNVVSSGASASHHPSGGDRRPFVPSPGSSSSSHVDRAQRIAEDTAKRNHEAEAARADAAAAVDPLLKPSPPNALRRRTTLLPQYLIGARPSSGIARNSAGPSSPPVRIDPKKIPKSDLYIEADEPRRATTVLNDGDVQQINAQVGEFTFLYLEIGLIAQILCGCCYIGLTLLVLYYLIFEVSWTSPL